jgi:excisionase family DNA binding protein
MANGLQRLYFKKGSIRWHFNGLSGVRKIIPLLGRPSMSLGLLSIFLIAVHIWERLFPDSGCQTRIYWAQHNFTIISRGKFILAQIMTVKEMAKYLRLHAITICKLSKEGKIPAFRIGRVWRFDKEVIDEWIAGG